MYECVKCHAQFETKDFQCKKCLAFNTIRPVAVKQPSPVRPGPQAAPKQAVPPPLYKPAQSPKAPQIVPKQAVPPPLVPQKGGLQKAPPLQQKPVLSAQVPQPPAQKKAASPAGGKVCKSCQKYFDGTYKGWQCDTVTCRGALVPVGPAYLQEQAAKSAAAQKAAQERLKQEQINQQRRMVQDAAYALQTQSRPFTMTFFRGESAKWWAHPDQRLVTGLSAYKPLQEKAHGDTVSALFEAFKNNKKKAQADIGSKTLHDYGVYLNRQSREWVMATARCRDGATESDYMYRIEIDNVRTFSLNDDDTLGALATDIGNPPYEDEKTTIAKVPKRDYIVLNADRIEDSTIFGIGQGNYNQMWEVDFFHGLKSDQQRGIRITWINPPKLPKS